MIHLLEPLGRKVFFLIGSIGVIAISTAGVFAQEHIALIIALVTMVGTVVATIAWFDSRIDKKISEHTTAERGWREADKKEAEVKHQILVERIRGLHELITRRLK